MGVVPVVDGAWPHGTQRVSIRNRLLPTGATPSPDYPLGCAPCMQAADDKVTETQEAKHDSIWRMNAIHEEEQDATSSSTRLLDLGAVVTAMAHLVAPQVCRAWQPAVHVCAWPVTDKSACLAHILMGSVFICMAVCTQALKGHPY